MFTETGIFQWLVPPSFKDNVAVAYTEQCLSYWRAPVGTTSYMSYPCRLRIKLQKRQLGYTATYSFLYNFQPKGLSNKAASRSPCHINKSKGSLEGVLLSCRIWFPGYIAQVSQYKAWKEMTGSRKGKHCKKALSCWIEVILNDIFGDFLYWKKLQPTCIIYVIRC